MDISQLFSVKGLVVVITGGGSGLGLIMAKALEANGAAKVFILGRDILKLENAAKQSKHGNIISLQCDITKKDDLIRAASAIKKDIGYINLLIANAGLVTPGQMTQGITPQSCIPAISECFLNQPWEAYTQQMDVHVTATLYTCMAFLDLLDLGNKAQNISWSSQIIATGSAQGFNKNPLSGLGYSVSKAAETHLIKSLAFYLAPNGIRCNVLAPGFYESDMVAPAMKALNITTDNAPSFISPMGRMGKPEEIAGLVLTLASKAGAYCSGSVFLSDGGRLTQQPSVF
ncbi:NAD(P)-binding Rossmann-fold containing protein [Glarea lozoyensis ATCC 20868]|uniref:NAD(P)-binding Rossmann-fold containing protein n=1 Tax=Glarea lozoyensis (strain ATCC 20868 / MF5171) TaxID=1116229 RepID=S3DI85_GLAL2|nr:NAD(P)-binding Rossmann-fold containing protein [Glarea lozoyensis ATCC 20868]EPE36849.1 NAD(P)-binding Rossmann-fold containing protein [Glarea lozoyensis ATCC 20868]